MLFRILSVLFLASIATVTSRGEAAQSPGVYQGDILVAQSLSARSIAIAADAQRWPAGIVPYTIDSRLPAASVKNINRAIEHWNEVGGISLLPVADLETQLGYAVGDYVRFVPGEHCASWIGRRGGAQDLWVAAHCPAGSVMHEIGHVLGLEHEHTRPDRDQYITIHWDNIDADKQHNFDAAPSGSLMPGRYDYDSIMHYGAYNFSSNGLATISTRDGVTRSMGQRVKPSAGDIEAIARLYGSDLSVSTQLVSDNDDSQLGVFISNQSEQGAHDLVVVVESSRTLPVADLLPDGWQCIARQKTAVQCTRLFLPGSAFEQLHFQLPEFDESIEVDVRLEAKTPDHDLSNNQSVSSANDSSGMPLPRPEPAIAAAAQVKLMAQDDPVANVGVTGGASHHLLYGLLLLLLVRQASGRIDRDIPLVIGVHGR